MKSEDSKKSGLSQSFIIGVIAVVFLLVGYQTSIFIHRAAVTKIAANRDNPDTVYVYEESMSANLTAEYDTDAQTISDIQSNSSELTRKTYVRKNSSHSPRAEAVREKKPYRKVESFAFNPNTISVEDLCRLGFSPKQAESIDNYRKKGGVFRRKEDFAKSYVVADSVYRRLEPYIDIPLLDLNSADVADLDNLPGIGEWFAKKIIEYRGRLKGYSCKEQLLEIYRFDQEKFDGLCDLVTVKRPYRYPLWTLPADSLAKHPHIRNAQTARSIIVFKDNNPQEMWTVDNLHSAGILSDVDAERLRRCVL